MTIAVHFVGGPWAGQVRYFSRNPRVVACARVCDEKRMDRGVYRTNPRFWRTAGVISTEAVWYVPLGQRGQAGDWGARWATNRWPPAPGAIVQVKRVIGKPLR